ncbi:MAG: winged helix-turn-helix domain-containing protein, partial [Firmicutes bacterium]|nr:winged helix-turn-helix domain-containing protein [Bacillota bacterium]
MGMESTHECGVRNKSSLTEEMFKDINHAVTSRCPINHGCGRNRWDTRALQRYVHHTYGREYSCQCIRHVLRTLGSSFRRGSKRPTRANKETREAFNRGLSDQRMSLPTEMIACSLRIPTHSAGDSENMRPPVTKTFGHCRERDPATRTDASRSSVG